jgi:hypothetical protein
MPLLDLSFLLGSCHVLFLGETPLSSSLWARSIVSHPGFSVYPLGHFLAHVYPTYLDAFPLPFTTWTYYTMMPHDTLVQTLGRFRYTACIFLLCITST